MCKSTTSEHIIWTRYANPNKSCVRHIMIPLKWFQHKNSRMDDLSPLQASKYQSAIPMQKIPSDSKMQVSRVWLQCMAGTYPFTKRVGLAQTLVCPYCAEGISETMTHFACVSQISWGAYVCSLSSTADHLCFIPSACWTQLDCVSRNSHGCIGAAVFARAWNLPFDFLCAQKKLP